MQDSAKLSLQLKRMRAKLRESEVEFADGAAELRAEAELLSVTKAQAELLAGKAKRAEGLAANSALAADAAETALNASMAASVALLSRQSSIARKKAQQEITSVMIAQTKDEIAQLMSDIKATKLRAETKGQITYIVDYRRGFAREGDVIAKITDLNNFEIEAEIPVSYIAFLENTKMLSGRGLDGNEIDVTFRVLLPVENLRSATRTVRFSFVGQPPSILQAENAVVVISANNKPKAFGYCSKGCGSTNNRRTYGLSGRR